MIDAVGSAISQVLGWVGTFITSLTTTTGALYPLLGLFAIGIAISAILLGKSFAQLKPLKKSGSLTQIDMVIRPEVLV